MNEPQQTNQHQKQSIANSIFRQSGHLQQPAVHELQPALVIEAQTHLQQPVPTRNPITGVVSYSDLAYDDWSHWNRISSPPTSAVCAYPPRAKSEQHYPCSFCYVTMLLIHSHCLGSTALTLQNQTLQPTPQGEAPTAQVKILFKFHGIAHSLLNLLRCAHTEHRLHVRCSNFLTRLAPSTL